jgi:hypothetical protein
MSGTTAPVLADDIDPVPLIRMYPEADGISDAKVKALAQGEETAAAGAVLEGSQYEPVLMLDADGAPPPVTVTAPTNVDVPYVSQVGSTLNCTMGNWTGEPAAYVYQWKMDGADIPSDGMDLPVTGADVGHSVTCVVTAENAAGTGTAPPSNAVVVAAP